MHKVSNVKLANAVRHVGISHKFAIDIQVETAVHALEHHCHKFVHAVQCNVAAVVVSRIAFGDAGWIIRKRIGYVCVLKAVQTVVLHATRHIDTLGRRLCPKIADIQHRVVVLYRPFAVKIDKSFTFCAKTAFLSVLKRNIVTSFRQGID